MSQTTILGVAGLVGVIGLGAAVFGGQAASAYRHSVPGPSASALAQAAEIATSTEPALVAQAEAPAEPAPANESAAEAEQEAPAAEGNALMARMMEEGAVLFETNCAACHGPEGGGQVGPPLRQNVESTRGVVRVMVNGRNTMPPMGADMTDWEITALVTYIRNSWGNDFGIVTEEEVVEYRKPLDF